MKQKYFIFGSLLTIIIIIVCGMLTINNDRKNIVYVKDIPGYGGIVTELSDRINEIENTKCQSSLIDILDFINKTHFEENVTISDYYKSYFEVDKSLINYLEEAKVSCSLNDNFYDSIYVLALSSTNYPNKVKNEYLFRYEFTLRDDYSRYLFKKDQDEVGTYTTKILELRMLDELLDEVEK